MQLLLQATWDTTDPAALLLAQQRTFNLIELFQECSSALPFSCPYPFSAGDEGFGVHIDTGFTPPTLGFYVAADKFEGGHQINNSTGGHWGYCWIERDLTPAVTLTSVDMVFDLVKGTFSGVTDGYILLYNGGSLITYGNFDCSARADGMGQTFSWVGGPQICDHIGFVVDSEVFPPGMGTPGYCAIHEVVLHGSGLPPC